MPRIFDNIEPPPFFEALHQSLESSHAADYCVGYFNLRGWRRLADSVERWDGGEGKQCRLLIGMNTPDDEELRNALRLGAGGEPMDNATASRLCSMTAEAFREQLTLGAPTNHDEVGLRRLRDQLRARRVVVKLHLRHRLHAKLYLHYRADPINPIVGFLGSSNLTLSGLSSQGELNVDVLDVDACLKLQRWFEARWDDRYSIDITEELIDILDASWARVEPPPPYHIYVKMAYHLSREAQSGIAEFAIPSDFGDTLLEFQERAVQISAHHLNQRGGVLIGDVVGLGKTLMATALARVFQDDHHSETLIICSKNLVPMWREYAERYRLLRRIVPLTSVENELPNLRRYRVVLIDESHNLRNRSAMRYGIIADYIAANDSACILLSATPYNKSYDDLASQLALFVDRDADLGVRPEAAIREIGEIEFVRRYQCGLQTLAAFEKSDHPDDWHEVMRLYMVRRTRSFIQRNYATLDPDRNQRFLVLSDGQRAYFPKRTPRTIKFEVDDTAASDPYARLYSSEFVDAIRSLELPRYGLGQYVSTSPGGSVPTSDEKAVLNGLGRAGKRLIGFCRTGLFKRLESGGPAFIKSIERHALRNYVFLHAVETSQPIPIGTQDASFLDEARFDGDADSEAPLEPDSTEDPASLNSVSGRNDNEWLRQRAASLYDSYASRYRGRFRWVRPELFDTVSLTKALTDDSTALVHLLARCGAWDPSLDSKLNALQHLLEVDHRSEKVLVFTQYADTVVYLEEQLIGRGLERVKGVTGDDLDPTGLAWRFSPVSNGKREEVDVDDELRVLIATDVLSEGQNLQDCSIVVNFDLPWALVRLVQRAGRVDRLGQLSEEITCYSFLPADGVERIIRLRDRVNRRIHENAEVVGSDEAFFEDQSDQPIVDIYHEKAGILDGEEDSEVDLASEALQVWTDAVERDPSLRETIESLPNVVYSARAHTATPARPCGVLVYLQTAQGNDSLGWIDQDGELASQSMVTVFRASRCDPETPPAARAEAHHELVASAVDGMLQQERSPGGQLGRPSGARFRVYERLKAYEDYLRDSGFANLELSRAIEELYGYPLFQSAIDTLNRQMRSGIKDPQLATLVTSLRADGRLCNVTEDTTKAEPVIVCSLGLVSKPDAE